MRRHHSDHTTSSRLKSSRDDTQNDVLARKDTGDF